MSSPKPVTTASFQSMKEKSQKISMLTAYDYTMSALLDQAGVDVLLVGDSLGMVIQGQKTTIPVTLEEMIYHGKLVVRGAERAMVMVDLPFPHGQLGVMKTLEVAAKVLKETGCQSIKLEGGVEQAETIHALAAAGIPVMAHVGLRPQSVHQIGGYRVQRDEDRLRNDAMAAQDAGAFGILMECVPADLATKLTQELRVPTIGIGAGPSCDGQVLVTHDLLGLTIGRVPKFVRQTCNLAEQIQSAVGEYNKSVRAGTFPAADESFQ
ncbi:MAG: 3-methyl-2-oxobutanoate hydroxymethyltransferase [Planctomycetota bacterium]|nr:3-methyl-2-oxobutanoate hydroxymethyltransferase [Planctomycetota bacterium]